MASRRILHLRQSATSVQSMTCAQFLQQLTQDEVQTYFEVHWYPEGAAFPRYITALPTLIVILTGQQPMTYGGTKCIETVQALVDKITSQRVSMEMRQRPQIPQVPGVHAPAAAAPPQQSAAYEYQRPTVASGAILPPKADTSTKQYMPPPGVIAAGDANRGGARGVPLEIGQLENGQYAYRPKNVGLTQRVGDLTHGAKEGGQQSGFTPSAGGKYDMAAELAKHSAHQKAVWDSGRT
jgi:hypothetical protein